MRREVTRDDVRHTRREDVRRAPLYFGDQLPLDHEDHVSTRAPVIGTVAGGVFDDPGANVAGLDGVPGGNAGLSRMIRLRDLRPVDDPERCVFDLHIDTVSTLEQALVLPASHTW